MVCGGLPAFHCFHWAPVFTTYHPEFWWWFVVVCGRLRWFVVVCLIVIPGLGLALGPGALAWAGRQPGPGRVRLRPEPTTSHFVKFGLGLCLPLCTDFGKRIICWNASWHRSKNSFLPVLPLRKQGLEHFLPTFTASGFVHHRHLADNILAKNNLIDGDVGAQRLGCPIS